MPSAHERHVAHLAHLRHLGQPTNPGGSTFSDIGRQSSKLDYTAEQIPWWQALPSQNSNLGNASVAPALQPNMAGKTQTNYWAKDDPLGWTKNYNQFWQGPNSLGNGPQNAFSPSDLQNMHAMGLGQLNTANRQAMQGFAGSNQGRGVIGNGLGSTMAQQLGVANAGALAQGDMASRKEGLTLGNELYRSRSDAANMAGGMANQQIGRQQQDAQVEKQNAFQQMQSAENDLSAFRQQYPMELFETSGQGKGMGDQTKTYFRAMFDDLKRNALIARQRYQMYG